MDKWEGEPLQQKFPKLHSFAIDGTLSLQNFCATQDEREHFHLPMSTEAYEQFNELGEIIPQLSPFRKDRWIWNGSVNKYSSMQMYKHLMGEKEEHLSSKSFGVALAD